VSAGAQEPLCHVTMRRQTSSTPVPAAKRTLRSVTSITALGVRLVLRARSALSASTGIVSAWPATSNQTTRPCQLIMTIGARATALAGQELMVKRDYHASAVSRPPCCGGGGDCLSNASTDQRNRLPGSCRGADFSRSATNRWRPMVSRTVGGGGCIRAAYRRGRHQPSVRLADPWGTWLALPLRLLRHARSSMPRAV